MAVTKIKAIRGTSVSYTHLDVYKRQALTAMHQRHETILLVLALSAERTVQSQSCVKAAPVSYTHLDVYKRQGLACGTEDCAGNPKRGRAEKRADA